MVGFSMARDISEEIAPRAKLKENMSRKCDVGEDDQIEDRSKQTKIFHRLRRRILC